MCGSFLDGLVLRRSHGVDVDEGGVVEVESVAAATMQVEERLGSWRYLQRWPQGLFLEHEREDT